MTHIRISITGILVVTLCISISIMGCKKSDGSGLPGNSLPSGTGKYFNSPKEVKFSFTWGVYDDAGQSWLDSCADKIKDTNVALYRATEGQMRFGKQTLSDKTGSPGTQEANVSIVNLDSLYLGGGSTVGLCTYGMNGYYIQLGGSWQADIFMHEFGHGQMQRHGPAEEYTCSPCVMANYTGNTGPGKGHYCDASDCLVGDPCWENYILPVYPSFSHTGTNPGAPPAFTVEITNK